MVMEPPEEQAAIGQVPAALQWGRYEGCHANTGRTLQIGWPNRGNGNIYSRSDASLYIKPGDSFGLVRCWQLSVFTSELTLLLTDTRKSSFKCLTAIISFSSRFLNQKDDLPCGVLLNRVRPKGKTVILDSKEVKQWALCLHKQCIQHLAEYTGVNLNRPSDF